MPRGDRRRRVIGALFLSVGLVAVAGVLAASELRGVAGARGGIIRVVPVLELPAPLTDGQTSFEQALLQRRAVRDFRPDQLTLAQLGQLLWAAQGETGGGRNAPSAGALYPLEIYIAAEGGVYHYRPRGHEIAGVSDVDIRESLAAAALDQRAFQTAPAVIAIAGVRERTAVKYGGRAERYVLLEVGHAGQNLLVQAAVIGVGAVPTGAFRDDEVAELFEMPDGTEPLYLIPVGLPA